MKTRYAIKNVSALNTSTTDIIQDEQQLFPDMILRLQELEERKILPPTAHLQMGFMLSPLPKILGLALSSNHGICQ